MSRDSSLTVEVLIEALPYIREFRGSTIVVKFGGNAMVDRDLVQTFADDIVLLHSLGIRPVVVHGGGPQIGDVMERFGKEPEFLDGLRVTDAETLEIAAMVLVGKVNRQIVSAINTHSPLAVGLSGEDGGLIEAEVRDPALGFVGDVTQVNTQILERLAGRGPDPGGVDDRCRLLGGPGLQHQRRHRRRGHRRRARRREDHLSLRRTRTARRRRTSRAR